MDKKNTGKQVVRATGKIFWTGTKASLLTLAGVYVVGKLFHRDQLKEMTLEDWVDAL